MAYVYFEAFEVGEDGVPGEEVKCGHVAPDVDLGCFPVAATGLCYECGGLCEVGLDVV